MTGRPQDAPRPPHTCTAHPQPCRACYNLHGCRCRDCATAKQQYQKRVDHGLTAMIPAAVIARHIDTLRQAGMNFEDMQRAGGVDESTIRSAIAGRAVQRRTAERILAIRPGGQIRTTSHGTARRLQALSVLGWSLRSLADECGLDWRHLADLRGATATRIRVEYAEAVAAMYDRLWDQKPQGRNARQVATRAARRGWVGPMAWDDGHGPHGIDNPNATPYTDPEQGAVETMADKARWLFEGGLRLPAILERLDTTRPTLYAAIHRTEPDLWERLTREEAA